MALGDQLLGITSLAERVFPVVSVVSFTENGPFKGPLTKHQVAPDRWFIASHSVEPACQNVKKDKEELLFVFVQNRANCRANHDGETWLSWAFKEEGHRKEGHGIDLFSQIQIYILSRGHLNMRG